MTNKTITVLTLLIVTSLGSCSFFAKSGHQTNFVEVAENVNLSSDLKDEKNTNIQAQKEIDTRVNFNEQSALRFRSPEGGVSLLINGFLVNSVEVEGNSVSRMCHLIKPGVNTFELLPGNSDKNATLKVADMSADDAKSVTAQILLAFSTEDNPGAPVKGKLTMEDETLQFKWHKATVLENVAASADEVYLKLQALAKALEGGKDGELIALLNSKHE